jgi:hypothetical protein
MRRWLKFAIPILMLVLVASFPLSRQLDTGSLEGLITDDRGPLAKASVELRNVMTGDVFRVESEADGQYRIDDLRPGRYSLWVKAAEHDSIWIQQIIVQRGEITRKNVRLSRSRTGNAGI